MSQIPGIILVSYPGTPQDDRPLPAAITALQQEFAPQVDRGTWRMRHLTNPSRESLSENLLTFQPTIVHLSGAAPGDWLPPGTSEEVFFQSLRELLTRIDELKLVFLARCATENQGKLICERGVANVLVFNYLYGYNSTESVVKFYRTLNDGQTVQHAFGQLRANLATEGVGEVTVNLFGYGDQSGWSLPVVPEQADMSTRGGGDVDWFAEPAPPDATPRGGESWDPDATSDTSAGPASFEAFPTINDPGPLDQGGAFEISVGFSRELDETLEGVQKIFIEKPKEVDFVDVLVVAVGARMDQTGMQKLFLNLNSQIRVSGTVLPQSEEVLLTVIYFYDGQPVGQGTRRIAVKGFTATPEPETLPPAPLSIGKENEPVDLVATATYSAPNQLLSWRIVSGGKEIGTPTEVAFAEGRQFAAQLMSSLLAESFAGQAAWNILQGLGLRIGQLFPASFYEALTALNDTLGRPPRVLLLTNEFYVPWELAFHEDLQLDAQYPPFLNLQTEIGRWLISSGITRQPVDLLPFDQFGVVAADYPFDSDQTPLEEAIKEKQVLIERHLATAIEAKKEDLLGLAFKPPAVGRILHLALHGYSRPDLNQQSIALEDGSLSAEGWLPVPFGEQKPALSFVFLNACQVGTAGSHLSQAGGFPGALFQRGLLGFIAPLWDVHDTKARSFSEAFYEKVLDQAEPIGKTMLELRRRVDYRESVTEMAYVYYGHPGLHLTFAKPPAA